MRKTIFIVLLTLVLGNFAHAQTNQKVTVQINQQKTVVKNKLAIAFVSLVDDSRCPTGTNCVWAGNAKIKIRVGKPNRATRTFVINTNLKPQTISYAGYRIKLTDLNPKPATNIRINRNGYVAEFSVSKL